MVLRTSKALALLRVRRYEEAWEGYKTVLGQIASQPRKWRVATRDQAAECLRRMAERNFGNEDYTLCVENLTRAFQIVEVAFRQGEADQLLIQRLGRILD